MPVLLSRLALGICLLPASIATIGPAAARAAGPRVELPISEVDQPNGARRYTVAITVDGQTTTTGLDTGSTGLRVLPDGLETAARNARGPSIAISYGAGVRFTGAAIPVQVGFGALPPERVTIQRVDHVTCIDRHPDCPASDTNLSDYRIMGGGQPGQGFVAILGIGLADSSAENPLRAAGVRQWVVELPRPGDPRPGRLILNPTVDEVARYHRYAVAERGNLMPMCVAEVSGPRRVCAQGMFDSGANGLRVQGGRESDLLPQGTAAVVAVGAPNPSSFPVTIGRRDEGSGMRLYPARFAGNVTLNIGIAPFFRWSVLYDADRREIGVADREP